MSRALGQVCTGFVWDSRENSHKTLPIPFIGFRVEILPLEKLGLLTLTISFALPFPQKYGGVLVAREDTQLEYS